MEWDAKEGDASDVIDRRGARGGAGAGGLGSVLGGSGKAKGGLAGIVIALIAAFVIPALTGGGSGSIDLSGLGLDNLPSLDGSGGLPGTGDDADLSLPPTQDANPELTAFANVVITDANNTWQEQFDAGGESYERTKMVLFTGAVTSGCGSASSAMGPFYCPADQRVYIDLTFFDELATQFGAPGDFAQAYVIAHEVGHHVQNQLGVMDAVRRAERDGAESEGPTGTSVRVELQADCFAGVWAHSRYERGQTDPTKRLDDDDITEALAAAEGVGDDTIQERSTGQVRPEGFTHGSAAQRQRWFTEGYDSGDPSSCDTFATDDL